ncbi:TonB-dependent receptor [candidate division KSB1 bacterium]|nr:TonB-dependent receptor [candidate division KSB1 bacterium]
MKRLLSLLLLFSMSMAPSGAYGANGKIAGRVIEKGTGAALPGANIFIESVWQFDKAVPLDVKMGAAADADGYYTILNVPPGTYDLKATMMGFGTLIKQLVRVNMDRTTTVDFQLEGTVIEMGEVQVTAEREVIKPDVSGTQEIILSERIADMPIMRVDEFVSKIKGVDLVAGADGQGLSIRGGAIRETDVRIDGISIRDPRSENSYLTINSTSVEELQVLTGGFEAKYGNFRSGLVNVVTRDGSRERYSISLKMDYTPSNQHKFFGTNPWSDESLIYRVYADTSSTGYAYTGTYNDTLLPEELRYFRGWNYRREGNKNYEAIGLPPGTILTAEQKRQLWLQQHPQYEYADNPDIFVEGTLTGPVPGSWIPFLGEALGRTTFMLAGKYENTQFAFPLGKRDNYLDWNAQLKLSTQISSNMKFAVNGLYANINTLTAGSPSTFGGALIDVSSRFNFLSSTNVSVEQQARLLGGSNGYQQMFNRSRLQLYDQRYIIGGAKFTHTISPKLFYNLDLQFSYTDHTVAPYSLDTTRADAWTMVDTFRVLNVPAGGSPNASTNWLTDLSDNFWLYGGLQAADSTYSWILNFKGDMTAQVGRHHQIETGFNFRYNYLSVNSGTWYQSEESWTPDTWQYYKVKPIEIGLYIQDKLEFQGMIANIGLRADYFNPNKKTFIVEHPLDQDYSDFYNLFYQNLPGQFGSWEKWIIFRDYLDNPTGWPTRETEQQFKLSPRLGVAFPITTASKMYFNYGHFYQRPNIHFLYNLTVSPGVAIVPSTDLDMAKTIAYEFGYEQTFLQNFLINVSFYYKDVKNEPLNRTYVDYFEEISVNKYFPDAYNDIRGIELRFEKNYGKFYTFWANYEYRLKSSGQSGLSYVYENRLKAAEEQRWPNITITDPIPNAHFNLNLHTPSRWGPEILGCRPLAGLLVNLFTEWRDGGRQIINPNEPEENWKKIEVVDYSNADLRASKVFNISGLATEFVVTVQNLFNQKRLSYYNMSTAQFDRYKDSLHLPFESGEQQGNDKLGEWDKDHIDIGWYTAPLFLNPRRVLLGLRVRF